MPPEPLDLSVPRECSVAGCKAAVDLRQDEQSISIRAAFDCASCGRACPAHYRRGSPLPVTVCRFCRTIHPARPASFSLVAMAPGIVRVRCETCRATWEEKFPTLRCPECGVTAHPAPAAPELTWPPADAAIDPRRFAKLSEAVRAGIQLHPLAPGAAGNGRQGRGALQAAWAAEFDKDPGTYVTAKLAERYPELGTDCGRSCPTGLGAPCLDWRPPASRTLEVAIVHLEDAHGWGREQVADWLLAHLW